MRTENQESLLDEIIDELPDSEDIIMDSREEYIWSSYEDEKLSSEELEAQQNISDHYYLEDV
ncbi:hypothetical protein Lepto7376_1556 [[Leptolyngbya] sp. PCC 7376]|uniref:hypothetical protein n=1 Tax=[Leptolyngbya] sp. PCC 7376 TaxID=111781 RepID=UPI00029F0D55|nr:hypothetical protein [[Leptolyngbya] sp. PCC 7376]AFY37896.1 hypothetical protein Lepto7376_1556 [[Leptolyngbya] sp. PCC 7376]